VQLTVFPSILGDVLEAAAFEAYELHHSSIEFGHLLLAIMVLPKSNARKALEAQRIDKEMLRRLVAEWYTKQVSKSDSVFAEMPDVMDKLIARLQPFAHRVEDLVATSRFDGLLEALLANTVVAGKLTRDGINPKDILRRLGLAITDE
jgi:ATP-dependent Clp protease ATP-binding subunit ClpA